MSDERLFPSEGIVIPSEYIVWHHGLKKRFQEALIDSKTGHQVVHIDGYSGKGGPGDGFPDTTVVHFADHEGTAEIHIPVEAFIELCNRAADTRRRVDLRLEGDGVTIGTTGTLSAANAYASGSFNSIYLDQVYPCKGPSIASKVGKVVKRGLSALIPRI